MRAIRCGVRVEMTSPESSRVRFKRGTEPSFPSRTRGDDDAPLLIWAERRIPSGEEMTADLGVLPIDRVVQREGAGVAPIAV